jgi:hypothetical protein
MTALVAYLDHFDMPSVEEAAATQEVLQLLTPQQQQAGPEDPGTRLSMQRSAATSLSGIMSPPHQFDHQGSGHQSPSGPESQQQIALVQQGRRDSAAQVSMGLRGVGGSCRAKEHMISHQLHAYACQHSLQERHYVMLLEGGLVLTACLSTATDHRPDQTFVTHPPCTVMCSQPYFAKLG